MLKQTCDQKYDVRITMNHINFWNIAKISINGKLPNYNQVIE